MAEYNFQTLKQMNLWCNSHISAVYESQNSSLYFKQTNVWTNWPIRKDSYHTNSLLILTISHENIIKIVIMWFLKFYHTNSC